jgi:hypothetical protein
MEAQRQLEEEAIRYEEKKRQEDDQRRAQARQALAAKLTRPFMPLWMLARSNPRATVITLAFAFIFNYVLYPVSHSTYNNYCDHLGTGTAVVLCHIEQGNTFIGAWLR